MSKGLSESIPMVHGSDVASMIKTLAAGDVEEVYHLAAEAKPVAEADLLQAIVNTVSEPRAVAEKSSSSFFF